MKNTYLTSYFPLLSIILFSLSISIHVEAKLLAFLRATGLFEGMKEFFSEAGIKLALLILLLAVIFMVFSALKLIADTVNQISLLFFSKDSSGDSLTKIRTGSFIYFIGGIIALMSFQSLVGIGIIFLGCTFIYFIFFVYKISANLSIIGMIGLIFFQVLVWSTLLLGLFYVALRVYNSIISSLPI